MECTRARKLARASALGCLGDAELADLDRHVADCLGCRAALDRSRALTVDLAAASAAMVPDGLVERVIEIGRAELAPPRRSSRIPKLLLAAPAAAVVALALLLGGGREAGRERDESWCFVDKDAGNSRDVCSERGLVPRRVLWVARVGRAAGAYKPLAWGRTVIVGTGAMFLRRGGGIVALDADSGAELWRREFPSGDFYKAKGFPDRCLHKGRLYVTDGERCIVLDASTGADVGAFAAPGGVEGWGYLSARGANLYGAARDGSAVFCVEAASGRVVWTRRLGSPVFVPALCRGRLYVHTLDGAVLALDADGGAPVWERLTATAGGRALVHARGERVVVLTETDGVTVLGAGTGEVRWSRRVAGAYTSGLAVGEDSISALAGRLALDASDGHVLWRKRDSVNGGCAPPTLANGLVLSATGGTAGSLNVYGESGERVSTLADVAKWACDGVVVAGDKAYTASGTRVLALACLPRG